MAGQAKAAGETNPVFPASTAVRIIPCLDIAEGRVVKGVKFQNLRDAGGRPTGSAISILKMAPMKFAF